MYLDKVPSKGLDFAHLFSEGLAFVKQNGKCCYINERGENAYREGMKSKEEHTKLMAVQNKRKSEIERQLRKFKADGIAQLTADGELTKELIEWYLSNK